MEFHQRVALHSGNTALAPRSAEELQEALASAVGRHEPILFFLPGVQTCDANPDDPTPQRGAFKHQSSIESLSLKSQVIERHLGDARLYRGPKKLNFFGLTYSREARWWDFTAKKWISDAAGRANDATRFLAKPNDYMSEDAKRFVETQLMPLLKDAEGALLPLQKMQAVLRLITFYGDSYGSIFSEQISNALHRELTKSGMPEKNVAEALKMIVSVCGANIPERNGHGKHSAANRFTGLYFEGRGDSFIAATRSRTARVRQAATLLRSSLTPDGEDPSLQTKKLKDNFTYRPLRPEELEETIEQEAAPYRAPSFEQSAIGFSSVKNGALVEFTVPRDYRVLLKHGEEMQARRYKNDERHQSYSYTYPLPHHRDHADFLGRALQNAVMRHAHRRPVTWETLLSGSPPAQAGESSVSVAPQLPAISEHMDRLYHHCYHHLVAAHERMEARALGHLQEGRGPFRDRLGHEQDEARTAREGRGR